MDTSNDKPEGVTSSDDTHTQPSTTQTPFVSSTHEESPARPVSPLSVQPIAKQSRLAAFRANTLLHKLIGVFILLLGVGYVIFANYPTLMPATVTPTPQPSAYPTDVPTAVPQLTAVLTPAFTNTHTWLIRLDKTFYSVKDLSTGTPQGRKDVTGILFSPMRAGEYLCMKDQPGSIYLRRKTESGFARLCDQTLPKSDTLHCQMYDPDKGVPIYATFYPSDACSAAGGPIDSGDYTVHATVYTECTVDAQGIGHGCKGIIDIDSPHIAVSN